MEFSKEEWMRHAEFELGVTGETDAYKELYMKVIDAYTDYPHDERTLQFTAAVLFDLMSHKNLATLSDNPDEWYVVGENIWRNKRNPRAYSNDAGETTIMFPEFRANFDNLNGKSEAMPDFLKEYWKKLNEI